MLADGTRLAKRSVHTALTWLDRRRLVELRRSGATASPSVTLRFDWR
jgi:hypothetical protein